MSISAAAEEAYQEGKSLEDQGKFHEAVILYSQALNLDPAYADVYFDRGFSYSKLGEHQMAVNDYTQAIKLGPEDAVVYHNRGFALFKLGDLEAALDDYDRAIYINPEGASTYFHRGLVKQRLGKPEQSCLDFESALKLNPTYTNASRRLGEALEQRRLDLSALRRYQLACRHFPAAALWMIPPGERLLRGLNGLPQAEYRQGAPAAAVASLKQELGVGLPDSYLEFLRTYDGGDFWFARMYAVGTGSDSLPTVIAAAKTMPNLSGQTIIPFADNYTKGFYYCFDVSRQHEGNECPVRCYEVEQGIEAVGFSLPLVADNLFSFIADSYAGSLARLGLDQETDDYRLPESPVN